MLLCISKKEKKKNLIFQNEEDSLLTIRAHLNQVKKNQLSKFIFDYFFQTWNATVLGWNSTLYADVQHFRVPAHLVWTPKLELINPYD